MASETVVAGSILAGVIAGLAVLLLGTALHGELTLQAVGGTLVVLSIGLLAAHLDRL